MKLHFPKKSIILLSIIIIILVIICTPFIRNYIIHKFYSASVLFSRDFQSRLRNDIECEVIPNPIPESKIAQLYPEEHENIVGFDYEIRVKNISSGYIGLEPLPETTISREFRPYVRFLDIPHARLAELRVENPEAFEPPKRTPEEEKIYEINVSRRMTFLGSRLK